MACEFPQQWGMFTNGYSILRLLYLFYTHDEQVCLWVCVSLAVCPLAYLKNHTSRLHRLWLSLSHPLIVSHNYMLCSSILLMTSCFHIIDPIMACRYHSICPLHHHAWTITPLLHSISWILSYRWRQVSEPEETLVYGARRKVHSYDFGHFKVTFKANFLLWKGPKRRTNLYKAYLSLRY